MTSLLEIFWTFFKIGLTTFGGGYAMISNVKDEVVDKKQWITNDELLDIITIAESTPGPIAINMATYVGYKKRGILGSIISTVGVVLPSILIILGITYLFNAIIENKYVEFAFKGIKAAVAILILMSGYKLLKETPLKIWQIVLLIVAGVGAFLIDIFSVNFSTVFIIIIAGLLGFIINSIISAKKEDK